MRTLFAMVLLMLASSLFAEWYQSDRFGIAGEPITEDLREKFEFTLRIERGIDSEFRELYRGDDLIQIATLAYLNDRLQSIERNVGGVVIETEEYRYWRDGSLRSVTQETDADRTIEYRYREGALYQEWSNGPNATERIDYDLVGRTLLRILWVDDAEVERESREYWGPAASDPLRSVTLIADGSETVRSYDEEGRLLGSSTATAGEVQSRILRFFENGLLVEERDDQSDPSRRWLYEYEEEVLVGERYSENDVIVKATRYDEDGFDRVESIYSNGDLGLRVFYVNERRVQEELVRDGEVFRVRNFSPEGAPE